MCKRAYNSSIPNTPTPVVCPARETSKPHVKAELALKAHVANPQCLGKIGKNSLTYTRLPLDFNSKSMSQNEKRRMLKYEAK